MTFRPRQAGGFKVAEAPGPVPGFPAAAPSLWRQLARGRIPVPVFCVLALAGVTLVPPAAGAGTLVVVLFPAAAVTIALALYARFPAHYVAFTWWIWFLTPAVRRLADYHGGGWTAVSPIMLTPYLVAAVAALTLVRRAQPVATAHLAAFGLPAIGIAYAYVIGASTVGAAPATFGLLTWLVPLIFGLHFVVFWRQYPLWRKATEASFIYAAVLLGIYGLVQFAFLPPWDAFWMRHAELSSIGAPEPFAVRVFGTLNAPGVFAMVLMTGLLLVLARSRLSLHLATLPAWLAFLLSQVRSAWLGYGVGLFLLLLRMRLGQTLRLAVAALLLVAALVPFVRVDTIGQVALPRLMSLTNLGGDHSLQARVRLYGEFLDVAAGNVAGGGIGSTNLATKLSNDGKLGELGVIDSGILEVLYVFGWIGSLLYLGGVLLALAAARHGLGRRRTDRFAPAAYAVVAATFAQIVFFNPFGGAVGMIFWGFLGLILAGQRHALAASKERHP